ncbi:MAG: NADH-quinone oxidoreductase subunit C [Bdellovibrionia bacterium]
MDVRQPIPNNGGDWITKFGDTWKKQVAQLQDKFAGVIEEVRMPPDYCTDVPIIYVKKDAILQVLVFLKDTSGFSYDFLADITATDEEIEPRFEVVYNLFSTQHLWRIRIKVRVGESEEVPTAVSVWKGANWPEREIYDMFGVKFKGHPNLRRILMDQRWVGHPLRKDYPLKGYQIFTDAEPADPSLLDL